MHAESAVDDPDSANTIAKLVSRVAQELTSRVYRPVVVPVGV
jgi:hypothetical protein